MKKLLTIAAFTLATQLASAQCFTLRDVVSNGTIKAEPSPGSWAGVLFIGDEGPYPWNTRLFSWDLGRLVHGTFRAYGYKRDDPNTPDINETNQMVWYENVYIAPCYNGVITRRFSACDVGFLSGYADTENLREFILQVTLYDAISKKYINTAYLRWVR